MSNKTKSVFPDEETFQRIYRDSMEDAPYAPENVRKCYDQMYDAFDEYLSAVNEYIFRFAYECGWNAALKAAEGDE